MKELKFITNIQTRDCLHRVSDVLDNHLDVISWQVDTFHPERILTIEMDEQTVLDLIPLIGEKGVDIQPVEPN